MVATHFQAGSNPVLDSMHKAFSVTIKDCEVQTFRSGGAGGQNQNKVSSGVRIIHHPSGARGECRETRDQLQNKRRAFVKMAQSPKFKLWVNRQLFFAGKSPEEIVAEQMISENLKIEYMPF